MRPIRWLPLLLLIVAALAGGGWFVQHAQSAALRTQIAVLRDDAQKLARLRAEHAQLRATQVSDAELERLRADHAALQRLRGEIEAMRGRAAQRERAEAAAARAAAAQPARSAAPPARILRFTLAPDGGLFADGNPVGEDAIEAQLSAIPRGERVQIRLQMPRATTASTMSDAKNVMGGMLRVARDLGLKLEVQMERPSD